MADILFGNGGAAASAQSDDLIKDTTTQSFAIDVLEASREVPVLVDFWAPWCGPCRQLTPALEGAVTEAKGKVKLVKMNIDEHPEIAGQMGIQSIPAVVAFVDGRPADGFMGALPDSQVKQFIERVAGPDGPDPMDEALAAAEEALAAGDTANAANTFAAILQQEPEHVAAIGGFARCLIQTGDLERAKQTLAMVPPPKMNDPAITAARAQLDLAEQSGDLGDLAELMLAVERNPSDSQAQFDLAMALNQRGDRKLAADHLLEIVKRDREWNEDGARKQLVTFFEAWGATDPLTVETRKRLSSFLFS
ncbi:MAG: thioredoxin [Pseudomonadota bacterium]